MIDWLDCEICDALWYRLLSPAFLRLELETSDAICISEQMPRVCLFFKQYISIPLLCEHVFVPQSISFFRWETFAHLVASAVSKLDMKIVMAGGYASHLYCRHFNRDLLYKLKGRWTPNDVDIFYDGATEKVVEAIKDCVSQEFSYIQFRPLITRIPSSYSSSRGNWVNDIDAYYKHICRGNVDVLALIKDTEVFTSPEEGSSKTILEVNYLSFDKDYFHSSLPSSFNLIKVRTPDDVDFSTYILDTFDMSQCAVAASPTVEHPYWKFQLSCDAEASLEAGSISCRKGTFFYSTGMPHNKSD